MKSKKKILVFSVPFAGHLNIIKTMIQENADEFDFKLVITGWKNIVPKTDGALVLAKSVLRETDPALWTFPRVNELLGDCLGITEEFGPDLIVYDFFSLEGYFAGEILDVPAWSSIPALVGPFTSRDHLRSRLEAPANIRAINGIEVEYGVEIDTERIEMISDGLHLPAQCNLIWSYPEITPENYMKNRAPARYEFLGNPRAEQKFPSVKKDRPLVYFSLGTVVMDNLWRQQEDTRKKLKEFIKETAKLLTDVDVVFVSQGKEVLDPPQNWRVEESVNQTELLAKADLFITHGGNNSFHESILQKTPMIVIPFFGDQPLVAKRCEELGIGVSLISDEGIDTKKSKVFLSKKLARRLAAEVNRMLDTDTYLKNLERLRRRAYSTTARGDPAAPRLFGLEVP